MSKVFLDPHGDDSVLFAAYQVIAHRPLVVVVYDSYIQVARGAAYCDWETRRLETLRALTALTQISDEHGNVRTPAIQPVFLGLRDDTEYTPEFISTTIADLVNPTSETEIWLPAWETNGHDQHNAVARVSLPNHRLHRYTTYTRTNGRTRTDTRVDPTPDMIARKHKALAAYTSQITNPSCRPWFTGDLEEYLIG